MGYSLLYFELNFVPFELDCLVGFEIMAVQNFMVAIGNSKAAYMLAEENFADMVVDKVVDTAADYSEKYWLEAVQAVDDQDQVVN